MTDQRPQCKTLEWDHVRSGNIMCWEKYGVAIQTLNFVKISSHKVLLL